MATGAGLQSHLGMHMSIESLNHATERSLPSVFLPDNNSRAIGLFTLLNTLVGMHRQPEAPINSGCLGRRAIPSSRLLQLTDQVGKTVKPPFVSGEMSQLRDVEEQESTRVPVTTTTCNVVCGAP